MSKQLLTDNNASELATLLIPIEGSHLIVPNVSVAEILDFSDPKPVDDVPTWYMGLLNWRTIQVPLICFEAINDQPFFSKSDSTRISILNGITDSDRLPFWGLVTQGTPRLMRVSAQEIIIDSSVSAGVAEQLAVNVNGELARIPNIEWIERQIQELP